MVSVNAAVLEHLEDDAQTSSEEDLFELDELLEIEDQGSPQESEIEQVLAQVQESYRKESQYRKRAEQSGYAHMWYVHDDNRRKGTKKEDEPPELTLDEIDGFILNKRLGAMNLSHAREYSAEQEEKFKLYKSICWNFVMNMVKYSLTMN